MLWQTLKIAIEWQGEAATLAMQFIQYYVLSQGPPHPGGSVEPTVSRMTATGNLLIKGSEAEECFVRRQANRMEGPRVAPELARRSEPSQRHLSSCV